MARTDCYQNTCAGVIARFEGFVAKFMGDGVLAYFGYPRAHEDEVQRAVRAGLALAATVGELKIPNDEALRARIGIATGLVVVGARQRIRAAYSRAGGLRGVRQGLRGADPADLTSVITGEGQAAVFITVDHCSAECVGLHASPRRRSLRGARADPSGACASASAPSATTWPAVLALRHDHGSQYVSHHFQAEIRFLGIATSPAFVREPEGMAAPSASSAC